MDATSLQVLMRETPLEVLTRAASLVAGCEATSSSDTSPGRKSVKRSGSSEFDLHSNIMKTNLPQKSRRLVKDDSPTTTSEMLEDENRNCNDEDDDEDDDDDDGGRRSAATQTSFSSFVSPFSGFYHLQPTDEVLRDSATDEEPCLILDLDQHTVKPSQPYHSPTSGTKPASSRMTEFENSCGPINLTVSISSRCMAAGSYPPKTLFSWPLPSASHPVGQYMSKSKSNCEIGQMPGWRPEKSRLCPNSIKTEPVTAQKHSSIYHESGMNGPVNGTSPRKTWQLKSGLCNYATVETDPIIDEHFRRSLGSSYSRVVTRDLQSIAAASASASVSNGSLQNRNLLSTVSVNNSLPPCTTSKSVTGAVDEHFAKSLGSAWMRIKSEGSRSNPSGNSAAVDDHFAKALGETWFKLKAEKRST